MKKRAAKNAFYAKKSSLALAILLALPFPCLAKPPKVVKPNPEKFSGRKSSSGNPGNEGARSAQDGPLNTEAQRNLERTQSELDQRQSAAANQQSSGAENAGCTGLLCMGSLSNATQAATSAMGLATAAMGLYNQATQRRSDILDTISTGAQSGQYPVSSVGHLHQLFKSDPLPKDENIDQLHPKIQDGAYALRTNQEELDILKNAHQNFTRTAETARGIERTLQGHANRGTTLAPGRIQGGRENARYPGAARAAAGTLGSGNKNSESSITNRSEKGLESGRSEGIAAGLDSASSGGSAAVGSVDMSAVPQGKTASKEEKLSTLEARPGDKAPGSDATKQLSSEAKAMLAGMMKELKDDIAKGPGGDAKTPMTVTDKNGKKVVLDHVPEGSALEGMLLTMEGKSEGRKVPSAVSQDREPSSASSIQLRDLDILGIDKSLFARVKDYLRERGRRDKRLFEK